MHINYPLARRALQRDGSVASPNSPVARPHASAPPPPPPPPPRHERRGRSAPGAGGAEPADRTRTVRAGHAVSPSRAREPGARAGAPHERNAKRARTASSFAGEVTQDGALYSDVVCHAHTDRGRAQA